MPIRGQLRGGFCGRLVAGVHRRLGLLQALALQLGLLASQLFGLARLGLPLAAVEVGANRQPLRPVALAQAFQAGAGQGTHIKAVAQPHQAIPREVQQSVGDSVAETKAEPHQ